VRISTRSRWTAWATSCGLIAFIWSSETLQSIRVGATESDMELSKPLPFENILINNFAPPVKFFGSSLHFCFFVGRDWNALGPDRRFTPNHDSVVSPSMNALTFDVFFRSAPIQHRGWICCEYFGSIPNNNVPGRCLPSVDHSEVNGGRLPDHHFTLVSHRFDCNISSQLTLGGGLAVSNQLSSSMRQNTQYKRPERQSREPGCP